jgi:hypothetical protein
LLSPILHRPGIPETVFNINGTLWFVCFEAIILINLTLDGYIDPNEISNRFRTAVMNKPAITTSVDAEMHRAFQRLNISPDEYTTIREYDQTKLGLPMKFVNFKKANHLAQQNKRLLKNMGTEKELVALGLVKPKKGYLAGW